MFELDFNSGLKDHMNGGCQNSKPMNQAGIRHIVLSILYSLVAKDNVSQSLDFQLPASEHICTSLEAPTLDLWDQSLENRTHKSSFKQDRWVRQC